jgi:hypothetical protein
MTNVLNLKQVAIAAASTVAGEEGASLFLKVYSNGGRLDAFDDQSVDAVARACAVRIHFNHA